MKFKKTLLVFCLIICVLFCVSSVAAGDVNDTAIASENQNVIENQDPVAASEVTTEVDNEKIENDVISSSNGEILKEKDNGTFTALQNKIDAAAEGSTITLENDYTYDDGFSTDGIIIDKYLIINGNGHTLNGLSKSRIFHFYSESTSIHSAELKNIKFYNGYHEENGGGAIYFESNFYSYSSYSFYPNEYYWEAVIDNCIFNGNFAQWGGAIDGSRLVINNSSFVNNYANDGNGGAITADKLECINCIFTHNIADKGGAIKVKEMNMRNIESKLNNCIFTNNEATVGDGGVIYTRYSDIFVSSCTFNSNKAKEDGGVIYSSMNNVQIENSEFKNNVAGDDGGAIYLVCYDYSQMAGESTSSLEKFNQVVKTSNFIDNIAFGLADSIYCLTPKNSPKIHSAEVLSCSFVGNQIDNVYGIDYGVLVDCEFKVKVVIDATDLDKYYGGSEKFTVKITKDDGDLSNANVKITVNGKTSTVTTDSNGQASLDLNLPVGTHDAVIECEDVKVTSKVTVKSTLTTTDASGTYSNSKVNATFLNTDGKALASKQVSFKVGDKSYSATTNSNGVATANIPLGVGTYTVVAVNPVNNEQKMFKLTISKADSKIVLTSIQSNGVTTLTATLTPTTASGNVVFNVNGENRNVQINNGKATLALKDLEAGNYTVAVIYNGDTNLKASTSNTVTFSVAEAYPVLTAKAVTKTYGTSTKLVVNLADNKGNAIANADVNVDINGQVTPITTDSSGQATMSINKAPGTYKITISALGKSVTKTITVKHLVTLKTVTVKKSAKKIVLQATLAKVNGKYLKNKKITFKFNGKKYTAKTNAKGVAKVTVKSAVLKKLKVGKKVTYQATYLKDTVKKTAKIKK